MLPGSGVQWLVVPRRLTPRIYVAGGGFGVRGRGRRAAHHIGQVHHGLGKVAGEDHGLSHLLKLEEERWRARLLPASPPRVARSLGTYQLVVVDHNQLHILGLTVHCRVAPADLGGGWALGISPLHAWRHGQAMDRLRGLDSIQGQCQPPLAGVPFLPSLGRRAGNPR